VDGWRTRTVGSSGLKLKAKLGHPDDVVTAITRNNVVNKISIMLSVVGEWIKNRRLTTELVPTHATQQYSDVSINALGMMVTTTNLPRDPQYAQ
jgi:hypothetical protein